MEEAREDATKQLYRDRVIDASILADDRVEDKRLIRAMQQMAQEKEMEESLLRVSTLIISQLTLSVLGPGSAWLPLNAIFCLCPWMENTSFSLMPVLQTFFFI